MSDKERMIEAWTHGHNAQCAADSGDMERVRDQLGKCMAVLDAMVDATPTPPETEEERALWRCYHCAAGFTKRQIIEARMHFGVTSEALPECVREALRRIGVFAIEGTNEDGKRAWVFEMSETEEEREPERAIFIDDWSLREWALVVEDCTHCQGIGRQWEGPGLCEYHAAKFARALAAARAKEER